MLESVKRLLTLIDDMTRKTAPIGTAVLGSGTVDNRVLHELYKLTREACGEIDRLEGEVGKAWADGDLLAWRDLSGKAMQSLIMMAGYKIVDGKLQPGVEGMAPAAAKEALAQLAEEYADEMVKRDNKKRKEAGV